MRLGIGLSIPRQQIFDDIRDKGYLSPDVKEALVGVWDTWGKSNEDADRATIKNKISGRGGDFILSNFAYKLNSGYGLHNEDYTTYTKQANYIEYYKVTNSSISCKNTNLQNAVYVAYKYTDYVNIPAFIPSYKVKVISNVIKGVGSYNYVDVDGYKKIMYLNNGINVLPDCYPTKLSIRDAIGFSLSAGVTATIEQLPEHPNSIVTDGVDDIIMSEKTVSEMVEGSNEITVVSMITNLADGELLFNNFQGNSGSGFNVRSVLRTNNILSIVGYSGSKTSASTINTILGDAKSIFRSDNPDPSTTTSFFYPISWTNSYNKVAYRWTLIAKRVLTTDEINQVIAYYNLDRAIEPDIYYDVKKQGLTNSTPDSDWYLKDFSKNGRDTKLYNFGKRLNSGVGKYITSFVSGWSFDVLSNVLVNPDKVRVLGQLVRDWIIYNSKTVPSYKVKITGLGDKGIFYFNSDKTKLLIDKDGIYEIAAQTETSAGHGFRVSDYSLDYTGLVIEQIPEHENGLVFDGVDDYAQYVGDLGLKDYTVVADRAYDKLDDPASTSVVSNTQSSIDSPFLFEHKGASNSMFTPFSFGTQTNRDQTDTHRKLSYQSTYKYNGNDINKGTSTNTGNGLTIGRYGGNAQFSAIVLHSLLLYPYSLSEFLIERQLKKLKLGTLYPNMVEFRPIIKGNIPYNNIEIRQSTNLLYNPPNTDKTGIYLQLDVPVRIHIKTDGVDKVSKIVINGMTYTDLLINTSGYYYTDFTLTKSPQKISYVIDEYIRYEDIVQPYPLVLNIRNAKTQVPYTYGDVIPVSSEIMFVSDWKNLLEGAYTWWNLKLNGETVEVGSPIKVTRDMVFSVEKKWILSTNEPKCIFSPRLFNIPNVGLKNLGYLPDISGHGNHGKMYNFAYTAGSGVGDDKGLQFDGVDDYIDIPNTVGGKQVMMKCNWSNIGGFLYDQRKSSTMSFAIFCSDNDLVSVIPAYGGRNAGLTYINGLLNDNIKASSIAGILHNIVVTNEIADINNPYIGCNIGGDSYSKMLLYDFMLFDEIDDSDTIKKLNNYIGIDAETPTSGGGGN